MKEKSLVATTTDINQLSTIQTTVSISMQRRSARLADRPRQVNTPGLPVTGEGHEEEENQDVEMRDGPLGEAVQVGSGLEGQNEQDDGVGSERSDLFSGSLTPQSSGPSEFAFASSACTLTHIALGEQSHVRETVITTTENNEHSGSPLPPDQNEIYEALVNPEYRVAGLAPVPVSTAALTSTVPADPTPISADRPQDTFAYCFPSPHANERQAVGEELTQQVVDGNSAGSFRSAQAVFTPFPMAQASGLEARRSVSALSFAEVMSIGPVISGSPGAVSEIVRTVTSCAGAARLPAPSPQDANAEENPSTHVQQHASGAGVRETRPQQVQGQSAPFAERRPVAEQSVFAVRASMLEVTLAYEEEVLPPGAPSDSRATENESGQQSAGNEPHRQVARSPTPELTIQSFRPLHSFNPPPLLLSSSQQVSPSGPSPVVNMIGTAIPSRIAQPLLVDVWLGVDVRDKKLSGEYFASGVSVPHAPTALSVVWNAVTLLQNPVGAALHKLVQTGNVTIGTSCEPADVKAGEYNSASKGFREICPIEDAAESEELIRDALRTADFPATIRLRLCQYMDESRLLYVLYAIKSAGQTSQVRFYELYVSPVIDFLCSRRRNGIWKSIPYPKRS